MCCNTIYKHLTQCKTYTTIQKPCLYSHDLVNSAGFQAKWDTCVLLGCQGCWDDPIFEGCLRRGLDFGVRSDGFGRWLEPPPSPPAWSPSSRQPPPKRVGGRWKIGSELSRGPTKPSKTRGMSFKSRSWPQDCANMA